MALLGAYRDTEASPELLKIAGQAQQLPLAGLTPDDIGALARDLAGTAVPAQVTAQLWQRSGGNPFFVRELIRLLEAQGSWHQPTQIPASVAETLRRRLARLSTECVRLLEWAAIAGRDVDVALLAHGAAVGHELAALSLLDEARQAGVIAGTSPPRFTHDLYRETILDGLSQPPGPRSTSPSAGRCRRDRVRPRESPRICWPRARRRGRTRLNTRSSRPGKPTRASDTRTPAPTTCARWTSSLNAAHPAPGNASRSCSSSPRHTSAPGAPTWPRNGSVRPPMPAGPPETRLGWRGRRWASDARVQVRGAEHRAARTAPRGLAAAGRAAARWPCGPGCSRPWPVPSGTDRTGCPAPRSRRSHTGRAAGLRRK